MTTHRDNTFELVVPATSPLDIPPGPGSFYVPPDEQIEIDGDDNVIVIED